MPDEDCPFTKSSNESSTAESDKELTQLEKPQKLRLQSSDSSIVSIDVNFDGKHHQRRHSGTLSPRLIDIRRRDSIDGFSQDEITHENETNFISKIGDTMGAAQIGPILSSPTTSTGLILRRSEFGPCPGSPKRGKFVTKPGSGDVICRRAESPLSAIRGKRRFPSETVEEPKPKRLLHDFSACMDLRRSQVGINRSMSISSISSSHDGSIYSEVSQNSSQHSDFPPKDGLFLHSLSDNSCAHSVDTPVNSRRGSSESLASIDSRDRSVFQSFPEKTAKKSLLPDADPPLDSNMEV